MILGLLWQIRSSLYSNPPAVASLPAAAECATANVGMIGGKGAAAGGGAGTSEVHQVQHKVQHEGASAEEAGGGGLGGLWGGGEVRWRRAMQRGARLQFFQNSAV